MKKIFVVFLIILLLTPAAFATELITQRIFDSENVISQESTLTPQIEVLSEEYGVDIIVVTTAGFGGKTAEGYADARWRDYGKKNGVLFLFSMTERKWYIYTAGSCMDVFDDRALDRTEDAVVAALKADDPDGAVEAFVRTARIAFEGYAEEQASWVWKTPLICLGIGALIALIVVLVLASQHKNVHKKSQASDYVRPGSFALTQSLDLYLYHTTTRRAKPQNSSGGSGSSGRSHGGRGGSF
ncbi:MAG: TPM domain-containing protein [Ruminococcaceae bacterium]|nr:TPM domain-containing protein [Oscillospiraceae bacterium]